MYNKKIFYDNIRPLFKSNRRSLTASRVAALDFLLNNFENSSKWTSDALVAYALATIARETGWSFKPITETGSKSYFNKYNAGTRLGKTLGNTKSGDGYLMRGRGFVQITGRSNYEKFGIAGNVNKALDPDFAFYIMTEGMFSGIFTGKKITTYINAATTDFYNARRVINGTDHATEIANNAREFLKALIVAKEVDAPVPLTEEMESQPREDSVGDPVAGIKASTAGATTFITGTLGGILSFIQGYGWEIIVGLAIFGAIFVIVRFWYSNRVQERRLRETMEREQRAHELELARLKG